MGQNNCCFCKVRCFGKRRRRYPADGTDGLERMTYINNPIGAKLPLLGRSPGCDSETLMMSGNYLNLDFMKEAKHVESSPKEEIREIRSPEFYIKNNTLILAPSKSDLGNMRPSLSSNCLSDSSSKQFIKTEFSLSEQETDKIYHHSLPYIPQEPTLTFLDGYMQDEDLQKSDIGTQGENEELVNEVNMDSSKIDSNDQKTPPDISHETTLTFLDGYMKNEDLQKSDTSPSETQGKNEELVNEVNTDSSKIDSNDQKTPPDIPPRRFEKSL